MSDSLYVKVGDSVEALDLGTGGGTAPEYVERIEALEAGQTTQDSAIAAAQSTASTAQATADAALPKAGGVMTGSLTFATSNAITKNDTSGELTFCSGTYWGNGAFLALRGGTASNFPGSIDLTSRCTETGETTQFWIEPGKQPLINGNPVLTSAGGTLTGNLTFDGVVIYGKDNRVFAIYGGSVWNQSPGIRLFGKDQEQVRGGIGIYTYDGTNSTDYFFYPDGKISFSGNTVVALASSWRDGNNWYRKYSDGWIEQGGRIWINSQVNQTVTLNIPFTDSLYDVVATYSASDLSNGALATNTYTTSNFILRGWSGAYVNWYACGY